MSVTKEFDCARNQFFIHNGHLVPHPRTAALVADLQSHEEFRSLWDRHDVRPSRDEIKRFNHPDAGLLTLRRQTLTVAGAEDHVIIVYQPEPGSSSADALTRLL